MSGHTIPVEPTLTGTRVQLRPLRASDADDLFAVHSDPHVMRYWSHVPWTDRAQAAARIAQLGREIGALQEQLADPSLYTRDPAGFTARTNLLGRKQAEREAAEEEWLRLELLREEVDGA